jgi:two-component system, sensor histidine kinase and response regulator
VVVGADASGETIFVVDDIPANRALVEAALEDAGYRLVSASSGAEALALFANDKPACVLLDIRMPGMDGFEVARRMRDMPGGVEVPIIFVTALRDVDAFDQAMHAGGFDFLTKPVRPTELLTRVRAALALKRASAERAELTEILRRQRNEFMRAVLVNERMAAFLVHDLKNPVTGMQLAAELIQRDPTVPPKVREVAALIRSQAAELNRMILGLLDLNKADEGRLMLSRTSVELGPIVRDVTEALALRAETREVELVASVEVGRVAVDVNLFRRVLENLLDNALRHAPPRSRVRIEARASDTALELSVADAGRGVPVELRARIFERFIQANAGAGDKSNARGGRGLGLAFCKLVVEAHGGAIGVGDAAPGAVFWTRWPDAL